jgi:hypothetical protein
LSKATTDVVKLLNPFSSEERQKIIHASLMLLGENEAANVPRGGDNPGAPKDGGVGLSAKAAAWVRQNGLTKDQLDHVFDIDGGTVTLIADNIPGKSSKDKTTAVYVLQGIERLLATGEPTFEDKAARKLCEDHGCYNSANHAVYLKDLGNLVTGSKNGGWKVTTPGLKKGAEYVKEMANEA